MCKCCGCGSNKKEEYKKGEQVYECKKCGRTAKEEQYCCGQMMKKKK